MNKDIDFSKKFEGEFNPVKLWIGEKMLIVAFNIVEEGPLLE